MNYKLILLALFLSPTVSLLSMDFDEEMYQEMRSLIRFTCSKVSEKLTAEKSLLNDALNTYRQLARDMQKHKQENLWKIPDYREVMVVSQNILQDVAWQDAYIAAYYSACNATRRQLDDSEKLWDQFMVTATTLIAQRVSERCTINFDVLGSVKFFKENERFNHGNDVLYLKSALFMLFYLKQVKDSAIAGIKK